MRVKYSKEKRTGEILCFVFAGALAFFALYPDFEDGWSVPPIVRWLIVLAVFFLGVGMSRGAAKCRRERKKLTDSGCVCRGKIIKIKPIHGSSQNSGSTTGSKFTVQYQSRILNRTVYFETPATGLVFGDDSITIPCSVIESRRNEAETPETVYHLAVEVAEENVGQQLHPSAKVVAILDSLNVEPV